MTVYFDESGNTGQDLLNPDQPYFIHASHNFSKAKIKKLLSIFGSANELHFKDLKNSSEGRNNIIKLLNHPLITEDNIIVAIANKEYVTCGHLVDRLIEPIYFDNNFNIYYRHQNMALANYLYAFGNEFWDQNLYFEMLKTFIVMVRQKSQESINDFYRKAELLFKSKKTKERKLLKPVLYSRKQISDILLDLDKFSIDITLSLFLVLINKWYGKLSKRFDVVHDDSKQIQFYEYLIKKLTNPSVGQKEIVIGTETVTLPYKAKKITLVDSSTSPGIQLADLIASSLSFQFNNKNTKHERFVDLITQSKLSQLNNKFYLSGFDYNDLVNLGTDFTLTNQILEKISRIIGKL